MPATIAASLDTRRMKKRTQQFPIKLRVTFNRKSQYYPTIFNLSKEDFNKLTTLRICDELQKIRDKIRKMEVAARDVINGLDPFSFDIFEREFIYENDTFIQKPSKLRKVSFHPNHFDFSEYEKKFRIFKDDHSKPGSICSAYLNYLKKLWMGGRYSTTYIYHSSYRSLKKFKGNVLLTDITVSFLHQYEQWMLGRSTSKSTIGIYLRSLRVIFNEAIEEGILKREKHYPFGRRKYIIPASRNIKKALSHSDIAKIYYHQSDSENENEQRAKDYWLFSYFANGINVKDIIQLKYKNIEGEFLILQRAKTERSTRANPHPISIYINEDLSRIMNRWGNKDRDPNNYIFPVLKSGQSPQQQYETRQLLIAFINNWMRKICEKENIERKTTTLAARHSFSTIMKRSGASTEFIQEALGHTDSKTTENYLDSFENDMKKEFAKKLYGFKCQTKLTVV